MPYQSRGFWQCSRCEQLFDDYHEAAYHESIGECRTLPLHRQQQQQQQLPPPHVQPIPPAHPANLARGRHAPPRHVMEGADLPPPNYPPTAAAAAAAAPSTSQHAQRPPSPLSGRELLQPGPRVLFGGNDTSQLTEHDSVAVRNLELFAVDHPEAMDSYGNRLGIGLVGIRCIHCVGPEAGPRSVIFPRTLNEVGDCIREVAEWHLGKCHRAPQNIRQVLQEALERRHKAKNEGGAVWFREEQDRGKLLDYCALRCRELRLVENYPPRTGIMFSYYGTRNVHPSESSPFEETKQPARPASSLDEPFDSTDIHFDDLNPEPFMVPDQPIEQAYDNMPANFPFFREPSGDWICKFCQHLHPQYRDGQSRWAAANRCPPPAHFIDFHLNHCRSYQQSLLQDYRGPTNPVGLVNPMRSTETRAGVHEAGPAVAPAALASTASSTSSAAAGISISASETRHHQPVMRPSAAGPETPYSRAIAYLEAHDLSGVDADGTPLPRESQLVVDEDRLLLTDYFYYLFKQLRLCRFTETDRKTRGGKRQTIKIGYGGLQCVHCAGQQNPRKFFWASVDRIANSFAEMPNHILKCRHCPPQTRDALLALKETHAEQMTRLPRGSQKVFLRRMWRRLHENDPNDESVPASAPSAVPPVAAAASANRRRAKAPPAIETSASDVTPRASKVARKQEAKNESPGTSVSEGTVVVVERTTEEAAKALAYSSMQTGPPSPSSRVLLSTPEDRQWLSDHDCFVRKQLEVFCATREDMEQSATDRKLNVKEGQVGIRCIHCALSKQKSPDGGGVSYPPTIDAIYDNVREFMRLHLDSCKNVPRDVRKRLSESKGASSLSSVLRNYFQMSAKSIGLVDTGDGIRASGQSVPLQSQEFTFAERKSPPREAKGRKPEGEGAGK